MQSWQQGNSVDPDAVLGILGAMRRMDEAKDADEITTALRNCVEPYGFVACLFTGLPVAHDREWHKHILHNGWPQGWYARYNAKGHYRFDPCVERSRKAAKPFFWSELSRATMEPAASLVMNEAADFGLREGICIPIHMPFTPPAVVTLSGPELDLMPGAGHIISLLAWHAFQSVLRTDTRKPVPGAQPLTEREREVLQWISAGKSAWDTSRILGISYHTVNTHLRNARLKLDTVNITHSIVEALRRREIQF